MVSGVLCGGMLPTSRPPADRSSTKHRTQSPSRGAPRACAPPPFPTGSLGPKGLGRPFTARNKAFTACLEARREAVTRTCQRLERLAERQNEQLLLEKLGLRDQHNPPTPDEIHMRMLQERMEARRVAEQRAADARAKAAKAEMARLEAERAVMERNRAMREQEEKEEAMRSAKRKAASEKAEREAKQAARLAEKAKQDRERLRKA